MRKDKLYGWAPPRHRWPAKCRPHRDGWVRWYKGQMRFVCSKNTPLTEVEDKWIEKKTAVDAAQRKVDGTIVVTYRQALSEFLTQCDLRVRTGKPKPMAARTLFNYEEALNAFGLFVGGGVPLNQIGPQQFSDYAAKVAHLKASGFDSVVCRVGSLFRWAVKMEYIDKYRPGPVFQRPGKQAIRDERISRVRSFTPDEIAKLWVTANNTMRCFIGLGVCAAFINSDVSHLPRICVDLTTGIVDFRRRKTGKVRRVCPLPADVLAEMKRYIRPDPREKRFAELFFLTVNGRPYSMTRKEDGKPTNTLSRIFANLLEDTGVSTVGDGRNFAGLRTTFYNLAPKSGYEIERMIIMGRAKGTIDLDHYLEDVGLDRLTHVVTHVWNQISTSLKDADQSAKKGSAPA